MNDVEFNFGDKIRRLRIERNLTLKDLAESTGFSSALISRIEHNTVSPPIATLYRISRALKVKMKEFFEEAPIIETVNMVRAADRLKAYRDGSRYGYSYETLAASPDIGSFEPLLVTIYPKHRERTHLFSHNGHEFIFILQGTMDLHYGKKCYTLKRGDSIFFPAGVAHSGSCAGKTPVVALSIRYLSQIVRHRS